MSDFNDDFLGAEDEFDFTPDNISFDDDLTSTLSPTTTEENLPDDDPFDMLRNKTARGETVNNSLIADEEVIIEEPDSSTGSKFSLDQFTPGQRLVLAILVILNIIVIGFGLLVILGII